MNTPIVPTADNDCEPDVHTPDPSFTNGFEPHVVLVAPEVHWNTGNIGRTCLGAGATLHLIRPLGFSLDSRQVKRAGLDYWSRVRLRLWEDFESFLAQMQPRGDEIALLTRHASKSYWQMPVQQRAFLVFGSETRGLPASVLEKFYEHTYRIPILDEIRSLNLSTAVGIALYETLRRYGTRLSM
ncbi:MAG: tRNA (cytidine(34)-2'-O)-methyltransferase [Desulfobacteraceae bacterium]|nr:MAG: tRNA (cytidine(34)-2'-O)-methyltransferase [Desulfobacteraceae bacterium]